jgi:hypothetical protein
MQGDSGHEPGLKEKAVKELKEFWIIAVYLALVFAAFTWYRRLILREFEITYLHYGVALIEALVIAKVILIGRAIGLGERYQRDKGLIPAALFKSVVYGCFVALFSVLEHLIEGLVHGKPAADVLHGLARPQKDEILSRTLVLMITFIPFFAFWEMARLLGENKLAGLLFKKASP